MSWTVGSISDYQKETYKHITIIIGKIDITTETLKINLKKRNVKRKSLISHDRLLEVMYNINHWIQYW